MAQVAREADVSKQTVSRVLNNKGEISQATRRQVLAIIERLGYCPSSLARGLATNRTMTLGPVVPDIGDPFFSEMTRGADGAAHVAGYSLLLGNTFEDPGREADVLRTLAGKRVDGIVLCSSRLPDDQLDRFCTEQPVVLVNRQHTSVNVGSVRADDAAGACEAVRHLIEAGRRVIGFLSGPPTSRSGQERAKGYADALQAAGLALEPALSLNCLPYLEGLTRQVTLSLLTDPEFPRVSIFPAFRGTGTNSKEN